MASVPAWALNVNLPPKAASATQQNIRLLDLGLTSTIWGHPQATLPWSFYELIDNYLGPWGTKGYPIAYGKFYCQLFNDNEKLAHDPQGKEWVRNTTIALQEPLRDLIVSRFRAGTLPKLTEAELRSEAFRAHPRAYTKGGLTLVTMLAPELIPVIVSIPGAEFDPRSPNFGASVKQVYYTIKMVAPEMAGMTLAGAAGPAHTGLFRIAADRDMNNFLRLGNMSRSLGDLQMTIRSGRADDFNALQKSLLIG